MALYHSVMMCFALLRMYVAALEISAVTFDHVSSSPYERALPRLVRFVLPLSMHQFPPSRSGLKFANELEGSFDCSCQLDFADRCCCGDTRCRYALDVISKT